MAYFALTPKNATMPNGNTPMEERGTVVLPSGFTHKGYPMIVDQHVKRSDDLNKCHLWYGPTSRLGYPEIKYDGYTFSARRWIFEYTHGRNLAKGLNAIPPCGNVMCVHPEHLNEQKAVENVATAIAKSGAPSSSGSLKRVNLIR